MRRNRIVVFQQNARQILYSMRMDESSNFEALRQTFETLRMIQDHSRLTLNVPTQPSTHFEGVTDMPVFDLGRRRFFVGQWVDAKDTIEQWVSPCNWLAGGVNSQH